MSQYDATHYATASSPPVGTKPPRAPVLAHYAVIGASAVTTAALVASALVLTLRTSQLTTWWEHGGSAGESTLLLVGVLGAIAMLGLIASFVATSVWLLRLRQVAEWASPGTFHRRAAYWAVLGWVVPVVHLWFPLQVVADAARGVGARRPNPLPWLIAWVVLSTITVLDPTGGDLLTASDLTAWIHVQQVVGVVAVVAWALWWRVVRSATTGARRSVAGDTVEA